MTWPETVQFFTACLPSPIGKALRAFEPNEVYELRIRAGHPVVFLTARGDVACAFAPGAEQVAQIAEALSEHALYARAEESRQGFVTLRGGHRMGLCGRVICAGVSVRALREIGSLCVRIAGQWPGAADPLAPLVIGPDRRIRSTLIIGRPGSGKTTMLRDLCRQLSDGGYRVGMADERSELAASSQGVPQLDVGANTDVLDGCCKEIGLRWLLRSMNPECLVTDELMGAADAQAVQQSIQQGVPVLATLHAATVEEAVAQSAVYSLAQRQSFALYAVLAESGRGRLAAVYDATLRQLWPEPV